MMGFAFVALLIGSVVVALAENSALATAVAFGLMLAGAEVYILIKMAGGFTIAVLPVIAVNLVLLAAPVVWGGVEVAVPVWARSAGSEEALIQAALIGMVFCAAYTAGAVFAGPRAMSLTITGLGLAGRVRLPNGTFVAIGYACIFLAIYGYQGALLQGRYLQADGPFWAVAGTVVAVPIAMLFLAVAAAQQGPWRGLAVVGIGIIALVCFGRSSRMLALLPFFLIAARAIVSVGKVPTRSVIFAGTATVFLQLFVLNGRGNPEGVGIIPLGELLFTRPGEAFAGYGVARLFGNVMLSSPLTSVVANRSIPPETFWVSVNPMPGQLAGWVEIKDSLRVNWFTPYNSLGELAAHGWLALAVGAAVMGFALALSSRLLSNFRGAYQIAASLLLLAITLRFSLSLLQYNLRSSARHIWYALFGLSAIWIASIVFHRSHLMTEGRESSATYPNQLSPNPTLVADPPEVPDPKPHSSRGEQPQSLTQTRESFLR